MLTSLSPSLVRVSYLPLRSVTDTMQGFQRYEATAKHPDFCERISTILILRIEHCSWPCPINGGCECAYLLPWWDADSPQVASCSPRFLWSNNGFRGNYLTWRTCALAWCLAWTQVAIFAAIGVSGSSPAQIGLVLTYTSVFISFESLRVYTDAPCAISASLTQLCGLLTRQSADVEASIVWNYQ